MVMRIAGEIKHSLANGPGIRYVVFFQGCPHHCSGCQNPDTHAYSGGTACSVQAVLSRIAVTKYLDGVTLSGGDPFLQSRACAEIARGVKQMGLNVWAYTGWTFETLIREKGANILRNIDVLVDGPYIESLKSTQCLWRGSSNQRLINVPASLQAGNIVHYKI